jgi:hypothetical protein
MSSLTSASTVSDAVAQFKNNSAWWESETKAKDLLESAVFLVGVDSRRRSDAGLNIEHYDLQKLIDQLSDMAKGWANEAVTDAVTVRRRSFTVGRPI